MKKTRLLGIALLVMAAFLTLLFLRSTAKVKEANKATAERLIADLRQILRAPADSALAHFEPIRTNPPYGTDALLEFLKQEIGSGHIAGGVVEVPSQALMDPADTNFTAAEAMGPLGLTYPPKIKIPTPDSQENYLKLMEDQAAQGRSVDEIFYLHMENPPYTDWVIRAYISPYNDKVHLVGLAFGPFSTLPYPGSYLIEKRLSGGGMPPYLALEFQNAEGQTAYAAGDHSGKSLIQQVELTKYDPGYCYWKINARASSPSKIYLILIALVGIIGLGLVFLRT